MMKDREGIYDSLLAMHEIGLLGRIFPDFEEIRCRVIRDFFHKYTVDEHSLIAIRNIEQLPPSHHFSVLLNELENPELLLLSLLFHDIGKSHRHDEGNHVHPSTEGVKVILEKLEIPPEQPKGLCSSLRRTSRCPRSFCAATSATRRWYAVCRYGRESGQPANVMPADLCRHEGSQ